MDVFGRDGELARIDAWLTDARTPGDDPADPRPHLVIEGEPGIGKTTLWVQAVAAARTLGWRVLSCRPVPSDAGLPHVALAEAILIHGPSAHPPGGGREPVLRAGDRA